MASVFLSYDRGDDTSASRIAQALEDSGHSVWWDRHIKSGAQYSREIDAALHRADAVVVLWSERSIESAWVRDEAATGRDAGKLVPARIEAVDPPLGFRQYQTADLARWRGRRRSPQFQEILKAIEALSEGAATAPAPPVRQKSARPVRHLLIISAVAFVGLIAIALAAWHLIGRSSSTPIVAMVAADSSSESQSLARDLFVNLGALQTARPNSVEIVQIDQSKKPDLVFQVGRSGEAEGVGANLNCSAAQMAPCCGQMRFKIQMAMPRTSGSRSPTQPPTC